MFSSLRALVILLLSCLAFAVTSQAQEKASDWSSKDLRGRSISTQEFRGKVLLVVMAHFDRRKEMEPIVRELVVRGTVGDFNISGIWRVGRP